MIQLQERKHLLPEQIGGDRSGRERLKGAGHSTRTTSQLKKTLTVTNLASSKTGYFLEGKGTANTFVCYEKERRGDHLENP